KGARWEQSEGSHRPRACALDDVHCSREGLNEPEAARSYGLSKGAPNCPEPDPIARAARKAESASARLRAEDSGNRCCRSSCRSPTIGCYSHLEWQLWEEGRSCPKQAPLRRPFHYRRCHGSTTDLA